MDRLRKTLARERKMESIMRDHGTSLRLFYPRDACYVDLLPQNKCDKVNKVEIVYGVINAVSDDGSWFPKLVETILRKITNLTNFSLSFECFVPRIPIKALSELLERRADTLQVLDVDRGQPELSGTLEDCQLFCQSLSRTTKLHKINMGRSLGRIYRTDRNTYVTHSRRYLVAVQDLSSLEEFTIDALRYDQNEFFSEALANLCTQKGKPLSIKISSPSKQNLAGALQLQDSRVVRLCIEGPLEIGNSVDMIVEGVNANKNLRELRIIEGYINERDHELSLRTAVPFLSGVVASQSLETLELKLSLTDLESFDHHLEDRLCVAFQTNTSLKRLQVGHRTKNSSKEFLRFLVCILRALASNTTIQDVQLETRFILPDYKKVVISSQREFFDFLSSNYDKELAQAFKEAKNSLLSSLRSNKKVALSSLKISDCWLKASTLPFLSYEEKFWCFEHRVLLHQLDDHDAWVDALITSNAEENVTDCFILLRTNPSIFFSPPLMPSKHSLKREHEQNDDFEIKRKCHKANHCS